MDVKFSPGPWRIAGKGTIRQGDGWIADVHWRNREANAHLIAAAPDLYAALATVLGDADHGQDMSWEDRCYQGRIALAKARGESQ